MTTAKIIWTKVDEAPALATYSLLPIVQAFTRTRGHCGRDQGHLPGRAHHRQFPRNPDPRASGSPTNWASWANWPIKPDANIIKLPNVSASIPQLKAAIKELQAQGYKIPDFPGRAEDRRREGDQGPLRQGAGQRRQPGSARRQLGPPGAPPRSSNSPGRTRTRWAPGAPIRRPMWRI